MMPRVGIRVPATLGVPCTCVLLTYTLHQTPLTEVRLRHEQGINPYSLLDVFHPDLNQLIFHLLVSSRHVNSLVLNPKKPLTTITNP